MDKYITQRPVRGLAPGVGVYLILDENKKQTGQLTCEKDGYDRWVKVKNLEPIPWADFILSARFPTTPESTPNLLSCKHTIVVDGAAVVIW